MTRRHPTKKEREHLAAVAALGCIACEKEGHYGTPAECHHIREGYGAGQRASHFETVPLCWPHHRGGGPVPSIHLQPVEFKERYGTELELLAEVRERLGEARARQGNVDSNVVDLPDCGNRKAAPARPDRSRKSGLRASPRRPKRSKRRLGGRGGAAKWPASESARVRAQQSRKGCAERSTGTSRFPKRPFPKRDKFQPRAAREIGHG